MFKQLWDNLLNYFTSREKHMVKVVYNLLIVATDGEATLIKTFDQSPHVPAKGDGLFTGTVGEYDICGTVTEKEFNPFTTTSDVEVLVEVTRDEFELGLTICTITAALTAGGWSLVQQDQFDNTCNAPVCCKNTNGGCNE